MEDMTFERGKDYKFYYDVEAFKKYVKKHNVKLCHRTERNTYIPTTGEWGDVQVTTISKVNDDDTCFLFVDNDDFRYYFYFLGGAEQSLTNLDKEWETTINLLKDMIDENVITEIKEG